MFGSSGIYGMYGDTDQPWFVVSMAEATYTYIDPDTLTQSTKTFQGGDFFIGNYETAYLYWEYATHTLTIAGDVIIAGDLESANFVIGPPIVGYKLEHTTGNAYFGGAVIAGACLIGNGTTTAITIGNAINSTGNFVNDVINSAINTSAKEVLGGFVISDANTSDSGFKAGDIAWDSSGVPTTGSGVAMTPYGLVGANTGATTFSVSATTGNAIFGGELIAASGTFGTITAGALQGSLTVGGRLATTIGSAINASGNFINNLINARIDTDSKKILSDFTISDDNSSTSGFKAGDITWNSSGVVTGGTGVAMTPYGFVGANSGLTTFSISSITGNAVFSGDITGSTITGSIITGGVVQTAASGNRITMNESTNSIEFKNDNNLFASMFPYTSTQGYGFSIETSGDYSSISSLVIYEGTSSNSASITADTINLNGKIPEINLNGVTRTSWPASFGGTLNDLSINVAKNWGGYNITNLGSLIPGSGTTTLGNSSYYWSNMYINEIYGAYGTNPISFENNLEMNNLAVLDVGWLDVNGNCDIEGYVDINSYCTIHGITTSKSALYCETFLNLKPQSSNPTTTTGTIWCYNSGGTNQFRGVPSSGWTGSFDMTAV